MVVHTLLGERCSDNIPSQGFHGFFLPGQNAWPKEYVEPGMSIFVQQHDHILCDLCLCHKHLKHLVSEYLLQCFSVSSGYNGKHTVSVEKAV